MSLLMGELDSIARCAAQYRSERLAALGLKSCHASYLMGICDCPGISQEQLARRIYQNKSSVARQLAVQSSTHPAVMCCVAGEQRWQSPAVSMTRVSRFNRSAQSQSSGRLETRK